MSFKEGSLRARPGIAVAILMGAVLAIAVLALLWRSSAAAHASTGVERDAATAELAKAKSDLTDERQRVVALEGELNRMDAQLTTANQSLDQWQNKFSLRTKHRVASEVREAKATWIDTGYQRGRRAGYDDGYQGGRSSGYDDGYSDGAADSAASAGGGGGGGGGGSCNPNYSGCLNANASDYDCSGGSGDGPNYTGSVQVIGYDEYDLDADGDGWGCE